MNEKIRELLKTLPKIDELLLILEKNGAFEGVSRDIVDGKMSPDCRRDEECHIEFGKGWWKSFRAPFR